MSSVNHDHSRESRTGIPEVILAEPKAIVDLLSVIEYAMKKNRRVLITRIQNDQIDAINEFNADKDWIVELDDFNRTMMLYYKMWEIDELSVAILSAGTSDRYIVDEIRFCMRFFGYSTHISMDVGVAGIHRFKEALSEVDDNNLCIILVAGQDGALFPVVSGQTKLPVIAVPTSIGYGFGGKGETALRSALQSCAPGISTVNIDNGFGAASMAAKILNVYKNKY